MTTDERRALRPPEDADAGRPAGRTAAARPTSITVIGWMCVVFGLLGALGGVMTVLTTSVMSFPLAPPSPDELQGIPAPFRVVLQLFDYVRLLAAIQLALAVVLIAAGAAFLRLRAWARAAIEAMAWLAIAYHAAFGVYWAWAMSAMSALMSGAPDAPPNFRPMLMIMTGFGLVMILVFTIPIVAVIRVLRGPVVRQALADRARS